MKASIIIPVKNGMPFIPETLAALRTQDHHDLEVLVVDDASTDDTRAFVESLQDPRIILLQNAGKGCADAFNTGLARATGEIVMRCDADDIYSPHRLARQIAWLSEHPDAGAVAGYMAFMSIDGKSFVDLRTYDKAPVNITAEINRSHVRGHHCAMAYRIEPVRRIGGMRAWFHLCEDFDFLVRLSEVCQIWYLDEKTYTARLRPNSLSRSLRAEVSDWYLAQVEAFRRQRAETGQDQLQAGNPPPVPTWDQMRTPQKTQSVAVSLLIGAAWNEMTFAHLGQWLKYSLRAIRRAPTNRQAWWTLTALPFHILKKFRSKPPVNLPSTPKP